MVYKKILNTPDERNKTFHKCCHWDDVFTSQELDKIIEYGQKQEIINATVDVDKSMSDVRKSKVSFINVNPETSWIFEKLNNAIEITNERFYNFDLNGYSAIQYSEYHGDESGKYDFHMDTFTNQENNQEDTRKLSIVMMLNDPEEDFEGGEFQMNMSSEDKAETIQMKKGRIVFFPSFFIHRVTPVTKGIRRSLVIWVTGPRFI